MIFSDTDKVSFGLKSYDKKKELLSINGIARQDVWSGMVYQYYIRSVQNCYQFGILPLFRSDDISSEIQIDFTFCGNKYSHKWDISRQNEYYIINIQTVLIPILEINDISLKKCMFRVVENNRQIIKVYCDNISEIKRVLNNYNNYYGTTYNIDQVTIIRV
jgi:hypothetical protein